MALNLSDARQLFEELEHHIGHDIVCVRYGDVNEEPWNIAIECETCYEVLLDVDNPDLRVVKQ